MTVVEQRGLVLLLVVLLVYLLWRLW